ncbi:hypothetical protein JSQ81_15995 [Sporosarcina sp. Marseille-Q4063]|uniref:hypothetical protein n=1 Tax=Sporosarcina sp. Marseille-Q4063 TaxID=2810514 RepID=UPI001BB0C757|nr:hypothetical protein [Sporosarcina sp. Marseille-Q4063]QUW21292.1 hypothetical protein JSQ81_15995 [Sporosarcina sp. Marseille-Q4063]
MRESIELLRIKENSSKCVEIKGESFDLKEILTNLALFLYYCSLYYLSILALLPINIKNKFIYVFVLLILLLFGFLFFLPRNYLVKFTKVIDNIAQRIIYVHLRIFLSAFIITIMGVIILLILSFMIKMNTLNTVGIIMTLPNFVLSQPAALALMLILVFIFIEYFCYKRLIKAKVVQKLFSVFDSKVYGEYHMSKNLKSDFTVTITLMGFLPILIDSVFSEYGFAEDLKYITFVYFFCGVVPYIHLIYENPE